jgi:serine protease AprX
MERFMNPTKSMVRVSLLLLAALAATAGDNHAQDKAVDLELRSALARTLRVPQDSLDVIHQAEVELPYIGRKLLTAKVRERSSGRVHEITLDAVSRRTVVKRSLLLAEQARRQAKLGTLEPQLFERMRTLRSRERLEVALWLRAPAAAPDRPAPGDGEPAVPAPALAEARTQARKARLRRVQQPVLARLQALRGEIVGASELAPLVFAKLDKTQIGLLARHPDVAAVYLTAQNAPLLDVSIRAVDAPAAWWYGSGGGGETAGVAVVERGGIDLTHPALDGTFRVAMNRVGSSTPSHPTWVAGVIGSTDSVFTGVAPSAGLYGAESNSWGDADLQEATSWAVNVGARVHNNSWGDLNTSGLPTAMSRFHDTVVRDWGVIVVDAAGNEGPATHVRAPGLAYNVITVGSYDDRNTIDHGDDVMSSFSSGGNPISANGDREKPELAAPGSAIHTTQVGGGFADVDGTSFAAPHVAGAAAVLISHNKGGYLWNWPEGIKAILMASARNVEGDSRLSALDGAGGLSVLRAVQIVEDPSKWSLQTLYPGAGSQSLTFQAEAGQTVRAAIAWDATPDYALYDSQPGVDLDLTVYAPSGAYVTNSSSWDNTYEIVEFVAPESGAYELRVTRFRFEDPYTFLGVAWSN